MNICWMEDFLMIDLQESRSKLDAIDKTLVELFEQRMKVVGEVADYKISVGKPVFDRTRELAKIEQVQGLTHNEFNKIAMKELFLQIMSLSRRHQYSIIKPTHKDIDFIGVNQLNLKPDTSIVYYGEKGAYTEAAMLEYFGADVSCFAASSFEEVMSCVKERKAMYGVLPIENTSTGSLSDIYDLLAKYENYIIGEQVLKIEHVLLGQQSSKISDIKTVYSHSQAIQQCSQFLSKHPMMKVISSGSTAECAKLVFESKDKSQAAIASKRAGECYGLSILQEQIANHDCNATRFIVISNQKIYFKNATHTSLCFTLPHESGSLFHALSHFIYNSINLTKIESRPIKEKPFEYRFFIEVEGKIEDISLQNALICMKEETTELKVLGSYEIAR